MLKTIEQKISNIALKLNQDDLEVLGSMLSSGTYFKYEKFMDALDVLISYRKDSILLLEALRDDIIKEVMSIHGNK